MPWIRLRDTVQLVFSELRDCSHPLLAAAAAVTVEILHCRPHQLIGSIVKSALHLRTTYKMCTSHLRSAGTCALLTYYTKSALLCTIKIRNDGGSGAI